MITVVVALVPALCSGVYVFGWRALTVVMVAALSAVLTELALVRAMKRPRSVGDMSAALTGMLVGMVLPAGVPLWIAVLGAAFAISVAKMAFGGLGHNFINPALAARAFLMACYPAAMTTFAVPRVGTIDGIDGLSGATPLRHVRDSALEHASSMSLNLQDAFQHLFWGDVGGCIGETSAAALIAGAAILLYRRVIGFAVPSSFTAVVFVLFWLTNGSGDFFSTDALTVPVYQVLSGGLLLAALFMATDPVTSPVTTRGQLLFGAGCGLITWCIRVYGGYVEGVCYAVLIMNCVVPLLDRWTRPKYLGAERAA